MAVFITGAGMPPKLYDEHTLLLLHGEDLTDSSIYGKTITNNGVTVSTAQSKFGGKSLYFNGSANLLFDLEQLGDEFTIDWWENCESGALSRFSSEYTPDGSIGGILFGYMGTAVYATNVNGAWNIINGTTMLSVTAGSWVHWAFVRKDGTLKAYRNGILFASTNMSGTLSHLGNKAVVGDYRQGDHSYFKGYMDEFRISDVARWTSDFTPPMEPYKG